MTSAPPEATDLDVESRIRARLNLPASDAFVRWSRRPFNETASGQLGKRFTTLCNGLGIKRHLTSDAAHDISLFGTAIGQHLVHKTIREPLNGLVQAIKTHPSSGIRSLNSRLTSAHLLDLSKTLLNALETARDVVENDDAALRPFIDPKLAELRDKAFDAGRQTTVQQFLPLVKSLIAKLESLEKNRPLRGPDLLALVDNEYQQLNHLRSRTPELRKSDKSTVGLDDEGALDVYAFAEAEMCRQLGSALRVELQEYPNQAAADQLRFRVDTWPEHTAARAVIETLQFREDFDVNTTQLPGPRPEASEVGTFRTHRWYEVQFALDPPIQERIRSNFSASL